MATSRWAGQSAYRADQFDLGKLWQTAVEVIDPAAGRVVKRIMMPGTVVALLPANRVAIYSEDEAGEPHLRIYRRMLERP